MKKIIILGAAGSIGQVALSVVDRYRELLTVVGLHTHRQEEWLVSQKAKYPLAKLALSSPPIHPSSLDYDGSDAIEKLIKESDADLVLNAIAGADGLMSSIWSLEMGKTLALANKESLVMAGPLLRKMAADRGCQILPVDSEHSAIFYLLKDKPPRDIKQIILTASGGPFRDYPADELTKVTAVQAAQHPTWTMGQKISIDSASLANKGLEVIEAFRLFDLSLDQIRVVLHRQSMVHSFVKTVDGALYAQISLPSMALPIQNALLYPDLYENKEIELDLTDVTLSFEKVDELRFPLLKLAYDACRMGDPYPIVYNAANEVAVEDFIAGSIGFTDLALYVERALHADYAQFDGSLSAILNIDRDARRRARGK